MHGGISLQGKVRIQGSKNASLPILAAAVLTEERNKLVDCPKISDVYQMIQLIESMGGRCSWEEDGICLDTADMTPAQMPTEQVRGMRSSICLLGALLARFGHVAMEYPGGCVIGERPIDIHLSALGSLGVEFTQNASGIYGNVSGSLHGAQIDLPIASVGATENILLAAVTAEGITEVNGAAREPEITALCNYLQSCGAKIAGIGTSHLVIEGVEKLHGCTFRIPTDRIAAGTYLLAALATAGDVFLERAPWEQMEAVIRVAKAMGAECQCCEEGLYVQGPGELQQIGYLRTDIYPGFPTDLQSLILPLCVCTQGETVIEETIFENRFRILEPLRRMGAQLEQLDAHCVRVYGGGRLQGCPVEATELRGGAALVVAGLMADGKTTVTGCRFIERGYENICRDLRDLGARIYGS